MLVEEAKIERPFCNKCQLIYPNMERVEVTFESSTSLGPIFCRLTCS